MSTNINQPVSCRRYLFKLVTNAQKKNKSVMSGDAKASLPGFYRTETGASAPAKDECRMERRTISYPDTHHIY